MEISYGQDLRIRSDEELKSMAGYSATPLPKKLGLKEKQRIALINEPANFQKQLGKLPDDTVIVGKLSAPLDLVMLFVDREKALAKQFPVLARSFLAME